MSADDKDILLEYIEGGLPVRKACSMAGVDVSTFYLALNRDPNFSERYEAAKVAGVDALIHDGEEAAERAPTADSGHQVAGLKLLADYKFRMASRIAPTKWGEKAQVQVNGAIVMDDVEMAKRVAFLEALNAKGKPDQEDDGSDLA